MPLTPSVSYINRKLEPYWYPHLALEMAVQIAPSLNIARGTILGQQQATSQLLAFTNTLVNMPTGGTFTITVTPSNGAGAQTTGAIAWNASAATVQAALVALSHVGAGNAIVTGGPLPLLPINITLFGVASGPVTTTLSSLTGGTPATTVTEQPVGAQGLGGVFAPYAAANVDGTGTLRAIAQFDMQTDASGNITLSTTAGLSGMDFGLTLPNIPVWISGYFKIEDLITTTAADMTTALPLFGRIVLGSVLASGIGNSGVFHLQ